MRNVWLPALIVSMLVWRTAVAQGTKEKDLGRFFGKYQGTFVLLDITRDHYTYHNRGAADKRLSPCSTFKIPNSLVGLETGVISDAEYVIRWDSTRRYPFEQWNRDHTLRTAFSNSVVWYYQALASRVKPAVMKKYLDAMEYGNRDMSGEGAPDRNPFWLESSLAISANEQVKFLRRLHRGELPFSSRTMGIVLDIMKISEEGGVVFRGKTGTGGDREKGIAAVGWFVGSVTRDGKVYVFATNIRGGENPSGRTARGITEAILKSLELL